MNQKMIELAERDLETLTRARLMVSGKYRIPWSYGPGSAACLIRMKLINEGGYLTSAGHSARASLSTGEMRL